MDYPSSPVWIVSLPLGTWDRRYRRLLLVRDYFGVKPLYYHFDGQTLRFASEMKAILMDPAVQRQSRLSGPPLFS